MGLFDIFGAGFGASSCAAGNCTAGGCGRSKGSDDGEGMAKGLMAMAGILGQIGQVALTMTYARGGFGGGLGFGGAGLAGLGYGGFGYGGLGNGLGTGFGSYGFGNGLGYGAGGYPYNYGGGFNNSYNGLGNWGAFGATRAFI